MVLETQAAQTSSDFQESVNGSNHPTPDYNKLAFYTRTSSHQEWLNGGAEPRLLLEMTGLNSAELMFALTCLLMDIKHITQ